jgi:hypothetical protein
MQRVQGLLAQRPRWRRPGRVTAEVPKLRRAHRRLVAELGQRVLELLAGAS